ncbi:hypothetical protein ABT160_23505 [Streptomyces sp. NPDC001941]|uniref:hypothetical protein n=1 Tax=Streptomyces sp. NPDC001941 TaxID=3154659 RepID=UPI003326B6A0
MLRVKGRAAASAAARRSPVRTGDFRRAGFKVSVKKRSTREGRYLTARVLAKDKAANVIVLGSSKSRRKRHQVFNVGDFS